MTVSGGVPYTSWEKLHGATHDGVVLAIGDERVLGLGLAVASPDRRVSY